jgi:hypothetical protein
VNDKFTKNDHCFHEFEKVEFCHEKPTDILHRSASDFLQEVVRESKKGWKAFNILDHA